MGHGGLVGGGAIGRGREGKREGGRAGMQANEGGVERSIYFVERDFLMKDAQLKQMQGDTVGGLGEGGSKGGRGWKRYT